MAEATITIVRNATHGDFRENARISQATKEIWRSSPYWHKLSPVTRESLDQQALKVSRILSGQEDFADHWLDIEGYARLGRHSGEAK